MEWSGTETGTRGFLWRDGEMSDLSELPGRSGVAHARDINMAGQVVGYSVGAQNGGGIFAQATLWECGGRVCRAHHQSIACMLFSVRTVHPTMIHQIDQRLPIFFYGPSLNMRRDRLQLQI